MCAPRPVTPAALAPHHALTTVPHRVTGGERVPGEVNGRTPKAHRSDNNIIMPELHSEGDPFDGLDRELPPAATAAPRFAKAGLVVS